MKVMDKGQQEDLTELNLVFNNQLRELKLKIDTQQDPKQIEKWKVSPYELGLLTTAMSNHVGVDEARTIIGNCNTLELKKWLIFYDELGLLRDFTAIPYIMELKKPINQLISLLALAPRHKPYITWSELSSVISIKSLKKIDEQIEEACKFLNINFEDACFYEKEDVFITKGQPKKASMSLKLRITDESWYLISYLMPENFFQKVYGYTRCKEDQIPQPKLNFRFDFGIAKTGDTKTNAQRDMRTNKALRKLEEKFNKTLLLNEAFANSKPLTK